jgi:hypothetical protein
MRKLVREMNPSPDGRQAGGEHVVDPHAEPQQGDGHLGQDDVGVADHRPPAQGGDDGRGDPERREHDEVHLGVAEDPEQVLPQERLAATGGSEEVEPRPPLQLQEDVGQGEGREGEDDRQGHGQLAPDEDRHPVERHARGPHLEDRDDEVDRPGGGRDPHEDQAEGVEVGVGPRRVDRVGQRRVGEPPVVGQVVHDERRVEEDAGGEEHPVAEGVEPGEGHVSGADHERHQVVAEPRQHRRGEEEHHRHAVHGEQLVVRLGVDHVEVGVGQLEPHHQRLDPAEDEEQEPGVEVPLPDPLVVDGGEERPEPRCLLPRLFEALELGGGGGHQPSPSR